jgi:hypothetical protein
MNETASSEATTMSNLYRRLEYFDSFISEEK